MARVKKVEQEVVAEVPTNAEESEVTSNNDNPELEELELPQPRWANYPSGMPDELEPIKYTLAVNFTFVNEEAYVSLNDALQLIRDTEQGNHLSMFLTRVPDSFEFIFTFTGFKKVLHSILRLLAPFTEDMEKVAKFNITFTSTLESPILQP